jgi:hypothetical protein
MSEMNERYVAAPNRLAATSDMSPLLGAERTWRRHLIPAQADI